ncbi:MAG: DedA family protein [Helicobacter sp.]|nr:DedA family protein [Helicobacter sp.]
MDFESLGYLGLFLVCFIASSLYPLGSEVFVIGFIALDYSSLGVLIVATCGNTLGSLSTYYLGYLGENYGKKYGSKKMLLKIQYYQDKMNRWGFVYAFFTFLPLIGDGFAFVLGYIKYPFWKAVLFIALGKAFRYYLLIFGTLWGLEKV